MSKQVSYKTPAETIDGLLKIDYIRDEIANQVNTSTYFLSRLQKEDVVGGSQYNFSVKLAVSQGTRAVAENGTLPSPGFGSYKQASGNVKYLYAAMEITGQAIAATRGSKKAFASAVQRALDDTRESLKQDLQRQVWGNGEGVIGVVEAHATLADATEVGGGTTVAVTRPYGLTYAGTLESNQKTRLFKIDQPIVILDSTRTTVRAYTKVTGVTPSNGTITVSPSVPQLTAGDVIVRGDSTTLYTDSDVEVNGLTGSVANTGTYLNISRDSYPTWQSNLVQSAGVLSEEELRIAMDQSQIYGVAEPDLLLTDFVTRRRYEALLESKKRYVKPMELEGGFSALEFDGKPLVVDKDAAPERIYILRTNDWVWKMMNDVDWMDQDGSRFARVQGKDAYGATLFTYRDLVCHAPVNQTVLYGITS